ncbi:MAG: Gfo/Idh/MocA family oxidoreductase [Candidatus Pacebacteria bacterium]|jgi:UDP-N-acetyl-2-amino-2-deoxyglucuronate dehydrogenase|nr:Gfo/Idh/MocA family oxidoreductase [Candidatus Paceibacterota bacterium]
MKFVIIGTGFIFRNHLRAIRETGGEIVDVCDITHGRGEEWKKLVANPEADCAVVLAPNYLHYPIAVAANEAGKIVLSEKPMAIKSEHIRDLMKRQNIFVVQQLRYHPEYQRLEKEISAKERYDIKMDIFVYRDRHYFEGWKGDIDRSGGPLFVLGPHYFELLLNLFGPATEARMDAFDGKTGTGIIKGANYDCAWRVSVGAKIDEPWKREFTINGEQVNFSKKENLAEENLHQFVYRDLTRGKGVTPAEVLPPIELIEKLYADYHS